MIGEDYFAHVAPLINSQFSFFYIVGFFLVTMLKSFTEVIKKHVLKLLRNVFYAVKGSKQVQGVRYDLLN